jgi:hypothetical protein
MPVTLVTSSPKGARPKGLAVVSEFRRPPYSPGRRMSDRSGGRRVTDAILPLLAALGGTAAEVAVALQAEGITAHRGATTFRNPIVRYINRHLDIGGQIIIPVGGDVVTVVRHGSRRTIHLPEAVSSFLTRFHAGEFPLLEQP